MNAHAPSDDLLLISAVLPWCRRDLLLLLRPDPDAADSLLARDLFSPEPLYNALRMHQDARVRLLAADPRTARLSDRMQMHQTIVKDLLARLAALPAPQCDDALEQGCFAQLVELVELLNVRREWPQITPLLDLADAAIAAQPSERRLRLTYYHGLVAVRALHYDEGERLLAALADDPAISDDLRMRAMTMRGLVHCLRAEYQQALAYYARILPLAEQLGNREYQGLMLLNYSIVANELGDYEQALALVEESLEHFRAHGNPYRIAHALYEIGNTALQMGRWSQARQHFHLATEHCAALEMLHGQAEAAWAEALLLHVLGDHAASRRTYDTCLELALANGSQTTPIDAYTYRGLLSQSTGELDAALEDYHRALGLVAPVDNTHTRVQILYRIGTVQEERGDQAMAADTYAQAIGELEKLRYAQESTPVKLGLIGTTTQLYETMVRLCLALGRNEDAFDYAERARSRAFLDTLAQHAPERADTQWKHEPPLTAADIRRRLPPDAALIAFFTIGVLPREERMVTNLPKENQALRRLLIHTPQLLIFALTDAGLAVREAAIDPNLLRPGRQGFAASSFVRHRVPDELYAGLLAPVAHVWAGRRLLHLIPHGPLHHVPFAALRDSAGQSLVEHSALTTAPSATVLLRKHPSASLARLRTGLALGFNDAAHRIECAETEAALVASLMDGEYWGGADISVSALFEQAPRLDWLHICGHAEVDQHDPMKTALILGKDTKLNGQQIMDDLHLSGAHVVLSACTTGLSRVQPGDELFGIPRALLHAGAATVLCTLWDTEDCVALWVMERYYRALRQGLPPAQALRQAQLAVQHLTGRELAGMLDRLATLVPAVPGILRGAAADPHGHPFADPVSWAPFVIIGRA